MKRHDGIDNAVDAAIVADALASAASTGPESERQNKRRTEIVACTCLPAAPGRFGLFAAGHERGRARAPGAASNLSHRSRGSSSAWNGGRVDAHALFARGVDVAAAAESPLALLAASQVSWPDPGRASAPRRSAITTCCTCRRCSPPAVRRKAASPLIPRAETMRRTDDSASCAVSPLRPSLLLPLQPRAGMTTALVPAAPIQTSFSTAAATSTAELGHPHRAALLSVAAISTRSCWRTVPRAS